MRPKQTRVSKGIRAGGQFSATAHGEPDLDMIFPAARFREGDRVYMGAGVYGTVDRANGVTGATWVKVDGGAMAVGTQNTIRSVEEHLNATMPEPEGPHLPPVPESVSAWATGSFLQKFRPTDDPETSPEARGREAIGVQLRSALASHEADGIMIRQGRLARDAGPQPLAGTRSRQLSRHFLDEGRKNHVELEKHLQDTAPKYFVPGVPRKIQDRELELVGARQAAAEAAVSLTAGIGSLAQEQESVYVERVIILMADRGIENSDLADAAWDESGWNQDTSA